MLSMRQSIEVSQGAREYGPLAPMGDFVRKRSHVADLASYIPLPKGWVRSDLERRLTCRRSAEVGQAKSGGYTEHRVTSIAAGNAQAELVEGISCCKAFVSPRIERQQRSIEHVDMRSASKPTIGSLIAPVFVFTVAKVERNGDGCVLWPGLPLPPRLHRVVAEVRNQFQSDSGARSKQMQKGRSSR